MRTLCRLALLPAVLAPVAASAQVQLARVDGIVVDAADGPLAGAVVIVVDPLGAELRRVTADAGGRFAIAGLTPGRYAVTTPGAGAQAAVPVTVVEALPVTVTLRVSPAFRDLLVVEGARPAASVASRTSLAGPSIEKAPARVRATGLQAAVATLPGWSTEDNGLNLFGARYAYNFGNPFSGTHFDPARRRRGSGVVSHNREKRLPTPKRPCNDD